MKKAFCCILCILTSLQFLLLAGCKNKTKYSDYSFDYFDTVTTITGFENNKKIFKENCAKIKQKLDEYHQLYTIYSRYEGINNLTIINELKNGAHSEVQVDKKIIDMLLFSKEMYELTNKKLNIAMGSILSIWHNYRQEGLDNPAAARLPTITELKEANRHTDINSLIINKEKSTVFISDPKVTLDVGAIAKGYAVEEIALWMEKHGMSGYLLNVGGNIRAVGKRPDGQKWKVGIENPDTENTKTPFIEYLEIEEQSVVTSGSYQRYYTVDGKDYHHIIDPETLMPATKFKLVSVICKSSAKADALSTALFCMSYEEGRALVDSMPDTHAIWVMNNGEKKYSSNFISLLSAKEK